MGMLPAPASGGTRVPGDRVAFFRAEGRVRGRRSLGLRAAVAARMAKVYPPTADERRLGAMEGLRGLAVLMVFVCHYDVLIVQNLAVPRTIAAFLAVIGRMGTAGVDLFFLLSGFLIYRTVIRLDLHYGRFLVRRAMRIYPPFLAIFAVHCAVVSLFPSLGRSLGQGWSAITTNVAMNLALLPGFVNVQPIIAVAWSLSYEGTSTSSYRSC